MIINFNSELFLSTLVLSLFFLTKLLNHQLAVVRGFRFTIVIATFLDAIASLGIHHTATYIRITLDHALDLRLGKSVKTRRGKFDPQTGNSVYCANDVVKELMGRLKITCVQAYYFLNYIQIVYCFSEMKIWLLNTNTVQTFKGCLMNNRLECFRRLMSTQMEGLTSKRP